MVMTQKMVLFLTLTHSEGNILSFLRLFSPSLLYMLVATSFHYYRLVFWTIPNFLFFFSLPKKYVVHETDNVFQTYTRTINSFDLNMSVLGRVALIDIQKIYMTRLSPLIILLQRLLYPSHEGSLDCKDTFPSSTLLKYHSRYGIRKLLISYIII